jgi:arylsulfatase
MTITKFQLKQCVTALAVVISGAASLSAASTNGSDAVGLEPANVQGRPNFLLVVADDLGWSDIGAFGGEIRTPNLDALASRGAAMTQFYTAPTCSPTRAMLLTGVDHHQAGVGTMHDLRAANQLDSLNYVGELHNGVATVAEVLKGNGYQTFMAGKWHLAASPAQYPDKRGFDESFALLQGGASHFGDSLPLYEGNPVTYVENGEPASLAKDFYSSISYTDKLLDYLQSRDEQAPFFAYLAYTAPHDPLQVPDEWLDRYQGAYEEGPNGIRLQRTQRLQEMGLLPKSVPLWQMPAFPRWLPLHQTPWEERSEDQRQRDTRPMEIYASMVELMDQQLGRVIDHLEQSGELDNTYIIFLSDNGANGATPLVYPAPSREWFFKQRDNSPENLGKAGSHAFLGMEWAVTSATPWKLFKGSVGEGGIRAPMIVAGPDVAVNQYINEPAHVTGIVPTLYELASIAMQDQPAYQQSHETSTGLSVALPKADSLLALWQGKARSAEEKIQIKTELFGNRAVREGGWKAHLILPPLGSGRWELYNLESDPGETQNLALQYPDILKRLAAVYDDYATDVDIITPEPPIDISLQRLYAEECNWWCSFKLDAAQTAVEFVASIKARD